MTNTSIFQKLVNDYNRFSFTHQYIFGFAYKSAIYAVEMTADALPYICKLDKASRGAGYALRFQPTNAQKVYMLANGFAEAICSVDYFKSICTASKYNRGEAFESLIFARNNQEWKKDNIPFTKAGDITIGKTAYQIKFEKATFCNEKQIDRLASL